jgi:uncharacterized protein YuzE
MQKRTLLHSAVQRVQRVPGLLKFCNKLGGGSFDYDLDLDISFAEVQDVQKDVDEAHRVSGEGEQQNLSPARHGLAFSYAESDEDKPGVILDYDEKGNFVSLEVLDASKRVTEAKKIEFQTSG